MKRPKIKDYKTISGPGAYDYVADMNKYIDHLEQQINVEMDNDPELRIQIGGRTIETESELTYEDDDPDYEIGNNPDFD